MIFEPQPAIEFVRELTVLAERVAAKDIVVASLHIDYCFFGSWTLETRKNDEALRFSFDDRDRMLIIESSPIRGLSGPNEWKQQHEEDFPRGDIGDRPQRFIMNYLTSRYGN
jgi:hypothetical protein